MAEPLSGLQGASCLPAACSLPGLPIFQMKNEFWLYFKPLFPETQPWAVWLLAAVRTGALSTRVRGELSLLAVPQALGSTYDVSPLCLSSARWQRFERPHLERNTAVKMNSES